MRSDVFGSSLFCAGIFAFCGAAALLPSKAAEAADYTELLDAADDMDDFDKETYNPFDFNLEASFRQDVSSAKISREAPCVPAGDSSLDDPLVANNPRLVDQAGRCDSPSVIKNREMEYSGTQSTVNVALRAGLYKDLELRLDVPYVLESSARLKYASGVDETNSSVDPSDDRIRGESADGQRSYAGGANSVFTPGNRSANIRELDQFQTYRYFDLSRDGSSYERSGFGDPKLSLAWAPYNDERDDTKATLLFGMSYTMPIAPIKRADNDAVGEGKHLLNWKLRASKQFDWINPYFGLEYNLPLLASDSPLRKSYPGNRGQVISNPPMSGEITVGSEFIPYENVERGERYAIDLRFTMGYVSEGRDYTPLFDHMANSQCNRKTLEEVLPQFDSAGQLTNPDDVACAWIVQRPANAELNPAYDLATTPGDTAFRTDGLMTVGDYGTFAGQLGLYLQPSQYFQLQGIVGLKHHQEHFLSDARTGKDVDGDKSVALTGPEAAVERNPVYNPTYDAPGERFRIQEFNTWSFIVNAMLQF